MPRGVQQEWPSKPETMKLAEECEGVVSHIARRMGRPDPTVRRWLEREGWLDEIAKFRTSRVVIAPPPTTAFQPGAKFNGNEAEVTSEPGLSPPTVDDMFKAFAIDPDDWVIERMMPNSWNAAVGEGRVVRMHQLKLWLKAKVPIDMVFPAVDIRQRVVKSGKPRAAGEIAAILADQHAPYYDHRLNEKALKLLGHVEPERLVDLGDIGDYPTISKHRDNPAWSATAQESVQGSFELLAAQRDACPASKIVLLKGNHDWRLETELLARAERMYGIRPADVPGAGTQIPANSLRNLLHLDALGIELIEPELEGDEYKHAEYWLSDRLVTMHGSRTSKNAALDEVNDVGASVIMGHLHRWSFRVLARWENDVRRDLFAVEAPTLRAIGKSVGYQKRPKSQQGLVFATTFKDGSHNIEPALWDGQYLTWRGERW